MIGALCHLRGTELSGAVVGKRSYLGETDRYAVRYLDGSNSPQERWFTAAEISFDGPEVGSAVVDFEERKRRVA